MQVPTYSNDNFPDSDGEEHFRSCDYPVSDRDPYGYHPALPCSLNRDHGLGKHLASSSNAPCYPIFDYSSPKVLPGGHPCHPYHQP